MDKARGMVITFDSYAQAMKILHKIRSEYPIPPIIVSEKKRQVLFLFSGVFKIVSGSGCVFMKYLVFL
jgi:hypothetical protein